MWFPVSLEVLDFLSARTCAVHKLYGLLSFDLCPLSLLVSSYLPILTLTALKKVWQEKDEYRASNSQLKHLVNDLKLAVLVSSGCVLLHSGCYLKKYIS